MRVLVAASPGTGHVFPVVPLSWALRSNGHDVLVATAGDGVQRAASAGLTAVDVAPGLDMYEVARSVGLTTGGWGPHPTPALARERAVQLFTRVSELMLAGTERVARRWRPDVVVYGELHCAGAVVAARLEVPAVEHAIGLVGDGAAFVAEIWPRLAAGPAADPVAIIRTAPPSLGSEPAAGRWIMRPVPYNGGAVVPEELLDPPTQPRVLLTMGTVAPRLGGVGMVRDLIDAVVAEPLEILVALGSDPVELGTLPDSVRAYRWLPLTAALPNCSVMIHHGGAGTTLSALAAGVAQVIVPQGADQFLNAATVSQRGCAVTADPSPAAIRAGLGRALSGEFDEAAQEVRDEIALLATPADIAARLAEHIPTPVLH
ncbi:MAG: protein IroB [Pseudonocardiales bacterium]|nr:MAG: protein IroB [Pseudonocardiales bacterium]